MVGTTRLAVAGAALAVAHAVRRRTRGDPRPPTPQTDDQPPPVVQSPAGETPPVGARLLTVD